MALTREQLAQRVAQEFQDGFYVQPRNWYSHFGGKLHTPRHGGDAAIRKRSSRHGAIPAR